MAVPITMLPSEDVVSPERNFGEQLAFQILNRPGFVGDSVV